MFTALKEIHQRINDAAVACGRAPESVKLVAVSKTVPAEQIRPAVEAGVSILGENYIQEAGEKIEQLSELNVSWHFIGHLQSNKAKYAVRWFDLIHTVDSAKLAKEISKQAAKHDKVQKILIQVNVGMEASKAGIPEKEAIPLVREISGLENIAVKGLMTIPPFFDAPEQVRPYFKALAVLKDKIADENILNVFMEELSMGMSGDFETAVCEGATLVRIGTAIFGARQ
ncbi:MAG: YggS family pyridoxal phosphate-dependent enzyme [Desulfobacterales bacterium]|nr:YggS family pyridoxal phosphate-dependent enzyme [Desulfobacterales bacterium]